MFTKQHSIHVYSLHTKAVTFHSFQRLLQFYSSSLLSEQNIVLRANLFHARLLHLSLQRMSKYKSQHEMRCTKLTPRKGHRLELGQQTKSQRQKNVLLCEGQTELGTLEIPNNTERINVFCSQHQTKREFLSDQKNFVPREQT